MTDNLIRDLRFAARTLLRAPAFTTAVVVTMTLGIGATTSMFTVVNSIVLRPLPFPESDRVVSLCETSPRVADRCVASPANVADWARASRALESAGVARTEPIIAGTEAGPLGVPGGIASPGFFQALRVTPALGRLVEDRDMARGSNTVALVSDRFWRRTLGGDPGAVGRTLALDGRAFTVIGVLTADVYLPPNIDFVDVWKPLTASIDNVDNRNWRGFMALGRLAPDASVASLRAELDVIRGRLTAAYPASIAGWGVRVADLRDQTVGPARATLWIFMATTAFVLLIACANVAGLLLVRATRRASEFAVRASLGAGGGRLVRQLLTESLVLALIGGFLGLLLASWTTRAFVLMAPVTIPRLDEVAIDGRVALFTALLSVATALVFGVVPARQASKMDLGTTLKGRLHGSARETRLRSSLVVAELALALVLLVGAGLLTRTFGRLLQWDPGFDREGVVTSWMLAPSSTYRTTTSAVGVLEQARDAVATVPGLRSVGLGSAAPLIGCCESGALSVEGRPDVDPSKATPVNWFDVSPEYFDALGIALIKGRGFTPADAAGAPNVAVINQALARQFFPGMDPIGQRVTVMEHASEVVGVVADVKPYQPDRLTPPEIYWPIRQYPRLAAYLVMRMTPGVEGLEKTIRARVATVDPNVRINPVVSLDDRFARELVGPRFNVLLIGALAFVAVALAAVGVFGVVAYSVASRTREIGVRMALGATPRQLVAGVVKQGMTLAALGIALGLAAALALGRFLTALLYGLEPTDAPTLAVTLAGFGLIAAAASYLPARRAAHVDPLTALRHDYSCPCWSVLVPVGPCWSVAYFASGSGGAAAGTAVR